MNRRTFLVGLGATAAGASGLVGSGAFSSVEADRTVQVDVDRDARAFLVLDHLGDGERSNSSDRTLKFTLPSLREQNRDDTNPNNPAGLGTDSVYRFDRDAGADEPPLFIAQNRGTQPVRLYSSPPEASDEPSVFIFDTVTRELLTKESPSEEIGVGENIGLGLEVDTEGMETNELYDTAVTIHALTDEELL